VFVNFETKSIEIKDARHHAVAMTALMHGLRLYYVHDEVRQKLELADVLKAKEERTAMLEQGYGTTESYAMSLEAATVAIEGFKRLRCVNVNAGSEQVRAARRNIGILFEQKYEELIAGPQLDQST
jgi:hypothetical protein